MSNVLGKIYTSGGGDCADWLYPLGFARAKTFEEADVISFAGGSDISPSLYGEKMGKKTYANPNRDSYEVADFKQAVKEGKKIIGICRGLQLICALSGGRLIQHVTNHHGGHSMLAYDNITKAKSDSRFLEGHNMRTSDLREIEVNSIHHQMIYPFDLNKEDYTILSWSNLPLSTCYLDENNTEHVLPENFLEIETCVFHKTNAMGWQYHPEMIYNSKSPALKYAQETFLDFYTQ